MIQPLHDRVLVRVTAAPFIAEATDRANPLFGVVESVGEGHYEMGRLIPTIVKPGNRVVFGKYAGTELRISGLSYLLLREDEILGIVQGDT